jgi:hypothetical protein
MCFRKPDTFQHEDINIYNYFNRLIITFLNFILIMLNSNFFIGEQQFMSKFCCLHIYVIKKNFTSVF